MRAPIVKQGLMRLKYGSKVIESVESKLNQLNPGATKSEINQVINAMTNEEKAVLVGLQKPGMKKVIESATQETINGLKQGSKMATTSSLPEHIVNLFVYTVPVGKNLLDNISELKQKYLRAVKRQPSNIELKIWAAVKEKLKVQEEEELFNKLLNSPEFKKIAESKQMETAKQKVSGFEGKKPEEVKQELSKVSEDIDNIIKLMETTLKSVTKPKVMPPNAEGNSDKNIEIQKTSTDSTEKNVNPLDI
jgi:hypothetical protein